MTAMPLTWSTQWNAVADQQIGRRIGKARILKGGVNH